jgi:hypothetical protein
MMANQMPSADQYTGLSRKVLQYCNGFKLLADKIRQGPITDADWQAMEQLVDTANFQRVGVFLRDHVEVSTWPPYKALITQYGGMTLWEGSVRRITEVPGRVFLELEERNTRDGVTDVSNTMTIYEFNAEEKLRKLEVYVAHITKIQGK